MHNLWRVKLRAAAVFTSVERAYLSFCCSLFYTLTPWNSTVGLTLCIYAGMQLHFLHAPLYAQWMRIHIFVGTKTLVPTRYEYPTRVHDVLTCGFGASLFRLPEAFPVLGWNTNSSLNQPDKPEKVCEQSGHDDSHQTRRACKTRAVWDTPLRVKLGVQSVHRAEASCRDKGP